MSKFNLRWAVLAVLVAAVALPGVVFAAADEKLTEVTGVVKVEKTDAGAAVKAITITQKAAKEGDKDVVYNVVLDEKGKTLAELNGKTVVAKGVVTVKEGVSSITVKEVKEQAAKAA